MPVRLRLPPEFVSPRSHRQLARTHRPILKVEKLRTLIVEVSSFLFDALCRS